jgi:hypothetical protein
MTLKAPSPFVFGLLALLALPACDPGFPSSEGNAPIDRETFVEVYVDLRAEAVRWDGGRLPENERDRILQEHGVTADDLRAFVQVHGRNVPYMTEVWTEVDERMADLVVDDPLFDPGDELVPGDLPVPGGAPSPPDDGG